MGSIPNIPIWVEFFEVFRDLPEIWAIKSDQFKDKNKKILARNILLKNYKIIDPNANIDSLKRRVANIKTSYRRELKKVQHSQRLGAGSEDEYVPNLWYFDKLEFLRDQDTQIAGVSTTDCEEEEVESHHFLINDDDLVYEPQQEPSTSTLHSLKRKTSLDHHKEERSMIPKEAIGPFIQRESTQKDEASIFADSWAASYRKLSDNQQIYAKKAIEEILVLGQLNMLTFNSVNLPP